MVTQYKSTRGYDFDDVTSKIIGACVEVHKTIGAGWEEVVYQRALAKELGYLDLDFCREVWIDVYYKGDKVGRKRVDFVIEDIMLEIKAKNQFDPQHFMQTLSYLRASSYKIGLLINFGAEKIQIKRLINEEIHQYEEMRRQGWY